MRAFIKRFRAQLRLRLAYIDLRDKFADHRLALTSPYDDMRIIERWEDVLSDIELELACNAAEDADDFGWFDQMLADGALWRDLIGDDDDGLGVA